MSNHKLLLADDSVTIQKVVNLTFADEGIEVITVGDGNSAMEKFVEITPDLVMVDVNMPGVDGYRICEMIKQDIETKHVPVILLVGSFEPFDEDEARRVGANDYLTKPFQSIRQLVNKVTMLLNRENGSSTPAAETDAAITSESVQPNHVDELGDAGMDDEMIQTNQVGSLPVDEVPRFAGGGYEDEVPNEASAVEYPSDVQEQEVRIIDSTATQPLSSEEFARITSADEPEQTDPEVVDHEDDLDSYLDQQMVSEFATDEPELSDEEVIHTPFGRESFYTPVEIPEPKPFTFEEVSEEPAYPLHEVEQSVPVEEVVRDYEIVNNKAFSDEPDEERAGYADFTAAQEYLSNDESESESFQDSADEEAAFYTEPETGQADEIESESSDDNFEQRQNLAGWETVVDPEEYFKKRDQEFSRDFDTDPSTVEAVEEDFDSVSEVPAESEEFYTEVSGAETTEFKSPTGSADVRFEEFSPQTESVEYSEDESSDQFVPDHVVDESDSGALGDTESRYFVDEPVDQLVDQPVDDPVDELVDEPVEFDDEPAAKVASPAERVDDEQATAETEDVAAAPETTHSKVSSLVSNKDTTDAVESVIVSEFARQSISLSSEAIETIASKIADRISEKIIQEMASEVVSDLADLIVAKMERKKLE